MRVVSALKKSDLSSVRQKSNSSVRIISDKPEKQSKQRSAVDEAGSFNIDNKTATVVPENKQDNFVYPQKTQSALHHKQLPPKEPKSKSEQTKAN